MESDTPMTAKAALASAACGIPLSVEITDGGWKLTVHASRIVANLEDTVTREMSHEEMDAHLLGIFIGAELHDIRGMAAAAEFMAEHRDEIQKQVKIMTEVHKIENQVAEQLHKREDN